MKKGKLFIIAGPSGSGKDTLVNEVISRDATLRLSKSCTTRKMRNVEKDNPKYHFLTCEEFETMLENDEFLEYNVFLDNYYGTPKKPVDEWMKSGYNVILEIDVNGADTIRQKMPEAIGIFIMPPSMDILKERLFKRASENTYEVEKRMKQAEIEIQDASKFNYIIINDKIEDAVRQILEIVSK